MGTNGSTKPKLLDIMALVGNPDAYAIQREDGSYFPVHEPLTPVVVRKHRAGDITVGTYIVRPDNTATTLVFDIDSPDEKVQDEMVNNVTKLLATLGVEYAVEFSGKKGYHVWVVSDAPVPAMVLYRLGRGVRTELGYPKLEVYPKQTEVRDLGNLVKLPGGIHQVTKQENNFLGPVPKPNPSAFLVELSEAYPEEVVRIGSAAPTAVEFPCVCAIQEGVQEGGRNTHLFHLAVMLRKFSLSDTNVELVVRRANEASASGPLPDDELGTILENSRYSGPLCDQIDGDVHCGEQCIKAKHKGLYTRNGALKYAADGEEVVVRVKDRTDGGKVVELEHPDMVQGKAILADPK
jgi:hypothetical protein